MYSYFYVYQVFINPVNDHLRTETCTWNLGYQERYAIKRDEWEECPAEAKLHSMACATSRQPVCQKENYFQNLHFLVPC